MMMITDDADIDVAPQHLMVTMMMLMKTLMRLMLLMVITMMHQCYSQHNSIASVHGARLRGKPDHNPVILT